MNVSSSFLRNLLKLTATFLLVSAACGEESTCFGGGGSTSPEVPDSMQVSPTSLELNVDETHMLSAVVKGCDGRTLQGYVSWSSSNPEVASVDGVGVVTGRSEGTTVVRASAGSITRDVDVTVRRPIVVAPPDEPVITAPVDRSIHATGADISFLGSATDPQDGALGGASLVWTSSLDGQIGTGSSFVRSDLSQGSHSITLRATDSDAMSTSSSISIIVSDGSNQAPTATISSPSSGASFDAGEAVGFSGSASDPEDGTLTGGALVWTSSRDGQIGTGTSFSRSNLSVGNHTITLTATDSDGAAGSAFVAITIIGGGAILANRILFSDNRDGAVDQWEVYSMKSNGTDQTRITAVASNAPIKAVAPPGGTALVYERWHQNPFTGYSVDVYTSDPDGSGAADLRAGFEWSPSFSPDGTRIALLTGDSLITIGADGKNEDGVRTWFVTANEARPTLSPQAWWLSGLYIYVSLRPNLGFGEPHRIWAVEVATGNAAEAVPPSSEHASISSAGWMVYSSDDSGSSDIYIVTPEGTRFQLTSGPAEDIYPSWSPDGQQILFVSDRTGDWEIFVMDYDGDGVSNLTNHPADQTRPYWVPE